MEKLYYTAKEVAEMLDVSVSHAYKVIREGLHCNPWKSKQKIF